MEIICEIMRIKNEDIGKYADMHLNVSREFIEEITKAGFLELYVFMDGDVVVVISKAKSLKETYENLGKTEIFKNWTSKVTKMLKIDNNLNLSENNVINAKCIFNLTELADKYNLCL